MVVVVVAVEDDVERRQFVRRGGRQLEAAEHFIVRRRAHAEHGIGDDIQPGHTHQQGGMAEPNKLRLLLIFAAQKLALLVLAKLVLLVFR